LTGVLLGITSTPAQVVSDGRYWKLALDDYQNTERPRKYPEVGISRLN
jgi:hypothetical protein